MNHLECHNLNSSPSDPMDGSDGRPFSRQDHLIRSRTDRSLLKIHVKTRRRRSEVYSTEDTWKWKRLKEYDHGMILSCLTKF